jgi:NAD(P)-dependent dehydrogenase (short-subunit alcohol dehydrogenase family)
MEEFEGKTAVVTGAASGMGRALARRFADAKMRVVLADVEVAPLRETEEALLERGSDVIAVETDVRKLDSIEELHRRAIDAFGKVHVLCNNAGVSSGGVIWEQSNADWEWSLGVNLWAFVHALRTFVPGMIAHGEEGHIVNTASIGGLITAPGGGAYGVAKTAVVALSETLYYDLKVNGAPIGVSILCPGFVNTRILDAARNRPAEYGQAQFSNPDDPAAAALRQMMAAGMNPADVAEGVFNAIRAQQLYILTHPEFNPLIRDRMEAILEQRNPAMPGFG